MDLQKNYSSNCTNLPVWPEWLTPASGSVVSCVEERFGLGGAEVRGDKEDPAAVGFVPDEGSVIEPSASVVSGNGIGGVAVLGVSAKTKSNQMTLISDHTNPIAARMSAKGYKKNTADKFFGAAFIMLH